MNGREKYKIQMAINFAKRNMSKPFLVLTRFYNAGMISVSELVRGDNKNIEFINDVIRKFEL